jgi:NADPH-dependent curcumin reductase CurA
VRACLYQYSPSYQPLIIFSRIKIYQKKQPDRFFCSTLPKYAHLNNRFIKFVYSEIINMEISRYIFASRPYGMPAENNFRPEKAEINELNDNEVILKPLYFSVDPYMRGRMNETKSYAASWKLGEPIRGAAVARVIESKSPFLVEGDTVTGELPWATYSIDKAENLRKIDIRKYPMQYYLGILGMPGLTAYFGMTDICNPKKGETVVVSGAAGAVGLVAGQIAKILEAKVVGIAGSDEKCTLLTGTYGYDAAINYKTSKSLRKEIAAICPEGVDAYYDNVGGEVSDAVISNLAFHSKIALCGQISQYNSTRTPAGSFIMSMILTRSALLKGFIVRDYKDRFDEGLAYLMRWIDEDKLKYSETVVDGFEKLPEAFIGLFSGRNTGKMLVRTVD